MEKILFLDIDGVLNSGDNSKVLYALHRMDNRIQSRDQYGTLFDERCVSWLRWIVSKTNCKIVISSTWKSDGLRRLQEMWEVRDLPGEVIDITPSTVNYKLFELYAEHGADRGYEIQEWLETNKWDKYCIVDDMSDMLKHQNFVQTNRRIGIEQETAKKIVDILND